MFFVYVLGGKKRGEERKKKEEGGKRGKKRERGKVGTVIPMSNMSGATLAILSHRASKKTNHWA